MFVTLTRSLTAPHLSWSSLTAQNNNTQLPNNYMQILSFETHSSANNFLENTSVPSIQSFSSYNNHSSADSNHNNNNNNNNNSNSYSCNKIASEHQVIRPNTLAIQPSYFMDVHQQHLSTANDPVLPQFSFFMSPSGNSYNSSPASSSSILDFNYANITEVPSGSANTSPSSSIPEFYEVFGSQNDLSGNFLSFLIQFVIKIQISNFTVS